MSAEKIRSWLEEKGVTDLCINGVGEIWMDRGCGMEKKSEILFISPSELKNWVLSELSKVGKSWDARAPFVDATLDNCYRLHAVFPPVSSEIRVSIRKLARASETIDFNPLKNLKTRWGENWGDTLLEIIRKKESFVISGATGTGKTTLASDLLACVPHDERIISLEDTAELAPIHPHFIPLLSRQANADGFGEITLRGLLKQTLRMRPDRLVLGECRGVEVLELLQLLNTGHRGAMATLHANSPREALQRIELLCLLGAGGSISSRLIRELLQNGLQWIIHLERKDDQNKNNREISEISRIEGREGDVILLRPWNAPKPEMKLGIAKFSR